MKEVHSNYFPFFFFLSHHFLCNQSLVLLLLHKLNGHLNWGQMMQGHVLVSTQVVLHDGECTQNCTSPYHGQILQFHWGFHWLTPSLQMWRAISFPFSPTSCITKERSHTCILSKKILHFCWAQFIWHRTRRSAKSSWMRIKPKQVSQLICFSYH